MTTSLGRLVLDIAANAAGFERDMQRVSKSAKKEMQRVSRELRFAERDLDAARGKVTRLAGAFTALAGVGLAAAVREVNQFRREADQLAKTARVVGVTAEQLQELRFAAETAAGVAQNQLDIALQRFARRAGEAANGTGELVKAFDALGISARRQDGTIKTQVELLGEFADGVAAAGSQQEQLALAFKAFDSEGARLVNLLRLGSDGIEQLREQFATTGATIRDDAAEAAERFNDSLALLSNQARSIKVSLFSDLIEPLANYTQFLAQSDAGQKLVRDTLQQIGEAAKTVGAVIAVAYTAALVKASAASLAAEVRVFRLTQAKLQLRTASLAASVGLAAFGRAVSIATGPVGIAIGILATLGVTFFQLRSNIREAAEGIDEFEQRIDALRRGSAKFQQEQLIADFTELSARLSDVNEEIRRVEAELDGLEASPDFLEQAQRLSDELQDLRVEANRLRSDGQLIINRLEGIGEAAEDAGIKFKFTAEGVDVFVNALNEFALSAARDAIKRAVEIADAMRDMNDEIADVSASLQGPLASALREYQREAQRIAGLVNNGFISEDQAVRRLELLAAQYNKTRFELSGLADEMERMITSTLPAFIQQMLGVADASKETESSFSKIGRGFAQSIFNQQSIRESLSSAFIGFGGQEVGDSLSGIFEDALQSAFAELELGSKAQENLRSAFSGVALGIGQALQGNVVQGALTAAGSIVGAVIGGPVGSAIGSAIGSFVGGLFAGQSKPKFQVTGANVQFDLGTDALETALGQFNVGFREIEAETADAVRNALLSFTTTVASVIRDADILARVEAELANVGFSSRRDGASLERLTQEIFDNILNGIDSGIANFVRRGQSLEDQLDRFAVAFQLQRNLVAGEGLGLGLDSTLAVLEEARLGTESLLETYARLVPVTESLDAALALVGRSVGNSREALVLFGADLVALFGDNADALAQRLGIVLERVFSDEERFTAAADAAQAQLADLLSRLGIEVTDDLFTQDGFAALFRDLFGTLDAEGTAILIEAGVALDALLRAEEQLAELRGESAEVTRDAARIAEILAGLETEALRAGLEGVDLALFDLNQTFAELEDELISLGATPEELARLEQLFADERLRILDDFAEQALEAERQRLAAISDIFGGLENDATRAGLSGLELALFELDLRFAALQERLIELGATTEEIERLEEISSAERLRIIDDFAQQAAEAERQRVAAIADIIGGLENEATRSGLSGLALALFDLDLRFADLRDRLVELGASGEELARLDELSAAERLRIIQQFNDQAVAAEQQRLLDIQNFLVGVAGQALSVIAPARAEFASLARQLAENERRAAELGLSERQLQIVRLSSQIQLQQFIASLSESIASLATQLFGTNEGVNAATTEIRRNVENMRDAWLSAIDDIRSALDAQLLGPNSSLTPAQQLAEAQAQFDAALAAAQAGDLAAAQALPQLFNQLLSLGAGFFGTSTTDFQLLESALRAALENANLPVPPASPEQQTASNTAATATAAQGIELSAFEQIALATQLIDQIGLLSQLTEQSPSEIGAQFGLPIADLIQILTGEVPDLTGEALSGFFDELVAETNATLNELAQLEAISADQLETQNIIAEIASQQLAELKKIIIQLDRQFAGVPEFATGGPISNTGLATVHSGEFVVPRGGALVSDGGQAEILERIDGRLAVANSDRRRAAELSVEELATVRSLIAQQARKQRTDALRPLRRASH